MGICCLSQRRSNFYSATVASIENRTRFSLGNLAMESFEPKTKYSASQQGFLLLLIVASIFQKTNAIDLGVVKVNIHLHYLDASKKGFNNLNFNVSLSSETQGDLYSYRQRDAFHSNHSVAFDALFSPDKPGVHSGVANPIEVLLKPTAVKKGNFTLTIEVMHRDNGTEQLMDKFTHDFNIKPYFDLRLILQSLVKTTATGPSTFSLSYSIFCNDNLYGSNCDKYCKPESGHFECDKNGNKVCLPGFFGRNCQICDGIKCENGGKCSSTNGKLSCNCLKGTSGDRCEKKLDWCKTNSPCLNGGTCHEKDGAYICNCVPGYAGENCDQEIDECQQKGGNLCQNCGTCVNTPGSFNCNCPSGFKGQLCESDIDECENKPCRSNENCNNTIDSFVCELIDGNECEGVACGGNGDCVDLKYKYYCQCKSGFIGINCNYAVFEDFVYQMNDPGGNSRNDGSVLRSPVSAITIGLSAFGALHASIHAIGSLR